MNWAQLRYLMSEPIRRASPIHRRWRRHLRSLPVVPSAIGRPILEPSNRDFVICGAPRSGTTLMAAALFQPPHVLTVSEPWDGMRLEPAALFASLREEITEGVLERGRLDVETLQNTGRVRWTRDGEVSVPVETEDGYALGVKWPSFWQYIDLLPTTRFVVCVRHPAEVVASMRDHGGRLIMGLDYDAPFNDEVNRQLKKATSDWAERRILMYERINGALLPHLDRPNLFVARYERWFDDANALLADLGSFLGAPVGPGWVRIKSDRRTPDLSDREWELLNRHSQVARTLGYVPEPTAAK